MKKPLLRPRRGENGNIKEDIKQIGMEGVDWVALAQHTNKWGAVLNTVINL